MRYDVIQLLGYYKFSQLRVRTAPELNSVLSLAAAHC